ncbi:helix-hairpin-helix domain-containing protein [Micromonospora sp. NPDC003197]
MADDDETIVRQRLMRLLGRTEPPLRQAAPPGRSSKAPTSAEAASVVPVPAAMASVVPAPAEAASAVPAGVPRLLGTGAFDPGRRGVKALAVVAVLVVLGAAVWAWRSRPHAEPVPAASVAPSASYQAPSGPSGAAGEVVVAVAGKVRRPGLVRLPAGARVADALAAAGGVLPGVDIALLNLARKVSDGELILVGVTAPPGAAGQPGGPGAAPDPGTVAGGGGKVNLNTATLAQLDALPGVGPVLAQRILDHREQHGGFRAVTDLRQVTGIGDAKYEDLKDLVTV